MQNEHLAGHLPTRLKGLDAALCGGIPYGVLTELVGPAGIGKTQVYLAYLHFRVLRKFGNVIRGFSQIGLSLLSMSNPSLLKIA